MSGSEQIEGYLADFRVLRQRLYESIERSSYEQLNWRPNEKSWSLGHCAAHLCRTAEQYRPAVEAAVADARANGNTSDHAAGVGLLWKVVLWVMRPPSRLRLPAPEQFLPRPEQRRKELLKDISSSHENLIAAFESAKGLDLKFVRIVSPVSSSFVMTLPRCATFLIAHAERHLWQMQRLKENGKFPSDRGN